jgi:HK97 family phage prohead protease
MADKVKRAKVKGSRGHHTVPVEVRAAGDNVLTFIASTEEVARDQDIIRAAGWQLENYRANPVFLWGHDAWGLPIGKSVDQRIVLDQHPRLEIDVEFATEEENPFAPHVMRSYQRGFLKAVSVGYQITGYEVPDPAKRAELGMGEWGVIVTSAELLEVSAVTVPADPGALLQAGKVPDEMREAAMQIRSHVSAGERAAFDEMLRGLGNRGSGGSRKVAAALADLRSEMRGLRKEVRNLKGLRAKRPARKAPVVHGSADDPYGILNDID